MGIESVKKKKKKNNPRTKKNYDAPMERKQGRKEGKEILSTPRAAGLKDYSCLKHDVREKDKEPYETRSLSPPQRENVA